MIVFFLKKIGYSLSILLGIVILLFLLFLYFPSPEQIMAGQRGDKATTEALKREFGLDQPRHIQLLKYLNDLSVISVYDASPENKEKYGYISLFHFSGKTLCLKAPYLRRSFQNNRKVSDILAESFTGTAVLATAAILIAAFLGIILGSISALKHNSFADRFVLFIATAGISIPSFFAAIIIAWIFGYLLHPVTGLNLTGSLMDYDKDYNRVINWKNLILPAFALGIRPLAIITQLMRNSLLDVMQQDYIRTAYSKGLNTYQVVKRHALKNALNPVITALSGWFASLLAGSFFVEYIFSWKGIGKVTVESLERSDYPVVMGAILLVAVIFIFINFISDLSYRLLDPRVKLID